MFKSVKISKIFVLTLLSTILLLAIVSPNIATIKAQSQASITILDSLGGSTNPAAGPTTTYADGTVVTLTATPVDGYVFVEWQIVTMTSSNVVVENPYELTVSGGTDYAIQPIFDVIQNIPGKTPVTDTSTAAIVVVLAGAGGTTNPPSGTYALMNAEQTTLTAIPNDGWEFSHWVISGPNLSHGGYPYTATPTDNPYLVDHGYGNRYEYQAIFTPIGSTLPTPTPGDGGSIGGISTNTAIIIALVVVIVIILIAFGVFAMKKKK